MNYLYQGLGGGAYVTQCSPRSDQEREQRIEHNIEWETSGIKRGIERYKNEVNKDISKFSDTGRSSFADSDVGSKLVLQCMVPLVAHIKKEQRVAQQGFSKRGHAAIWWLPILCLQPEKISAVILRTVLAGLQPEVAHARPWTACSLLIGANIKAEREFDLWRDKQYKDAREEGSINLYKVMIRRCKRVDTKAARRFMRMSTDLDRLDWAKEVRLHLGMKCLDTLVRACGEWFEMNLIGRGYGTNRHVTKTLKLTPLALKEIEDDQERCEFNRPFLLPMLCEPAQWRWNEKKSKYSGEGLTYSEVQDASGAIGEALQEALETQKKKG